LRAGFRLSKLGRFFAGWAWLILKNVIGWAFILISPALGFTLPGPAGIPVFLIGFALITFPGKRRLTARVLHGKPMDLGARLFDVVEIVAAFLVPLILAWPGAKWLWSKVDVHSLRTSWYVAIALVAVAITWVLARFALRGLNVIIRFMPKIRRKVRPWLRRRGIVLLPPRHRRRPIKETFEPQELNEGILHIHERHRDRLVYAWKTSKPWLRRALSIAITVWIFVIMVRPLHERWPVVKEHIRDIDWGRFALASIMFAMFLLFFRAISWRRVLKGFGFKLPVWAAVRIWSTSEMARYLPGAIWQVLGRVYLIKPYGVNSVISSTSQILELCVFLFANVLVAGSCLLWYAAKISHDPTARRTLIAALCLMPTLAALLHPKIFYGIANRILQKIGKPPITKRLRGWKLTKLLGYIILGLIWQSLAVFLIAQPILGLKPDWWWMIAAAYCLGWIAGFLAFWAPAGLGPREWVFAAVMMVVVPQQLRDQLFHNDSAAFAATVYFLGFLLRLWTIVGEVILWAVSLLIDYRGALNRPDAPGRATAIISPAPQA
jgi:hypothetical protein